MKRLDALAGKRLGRGAKRRLQEALDVSPSYLSDLRCLRARMPLDKLSQALDVLHEHPAWFFYEALREEHMPTLTKTSEDSLLQLTKGLEPEIDEQVERLLKRAEERVKGVAG